MQEMIEEGYSPEKINNLLTRKNFNAIIKNIPQYFAISFLDFLQFNGPMYAQFRNIWRPCPMQNLFIKGSRSGNSRFWERSAIFLILRILYWFFFGFVICGLIKAIKKWREFGLIILIIFYFNLVCAATFGIPRYAIPIYPFYVILFVLGFFSLYSKIKESKTANIAKNKIIN